MTMTLHKSTESDGWSAWRELSAAGCQFHTAASVDQGERSNAIP